MGKIFRYYFKIKLLYRILFALVAGSVFGMIFASNQTLLSIFSPLGDFFIRLLKMVMVPIISCSLIIGTSSISPSKLGRVGIKSLFFYFLTSFFAICIGLLCGFVFNPGDGLNLSQNAQLATAKSASAPSISEIILNIVPINPFEAMAKGEILPIICYCVFFGIALSFCKDSDDERIKECANIVFKFFDGVCEIMYLVIRWVMEYAPIGVFALLFKVFAQNGSDVFVKLLNVSVAVYSGFALQIFVVYCLICIVMKLSPVKFLNKVKEPAVTAFVTRSSNGTLPLSMKVADEQMGIPKGIYSFVLPVGATINMNGTVIYQGVCAIFIANACGIDLSTSHYTTIILTSILAAIGTAGVPGAGAMMLLLTLESIGIEVSPGSNVAIAYGMILGIDAILDMGRTSMNVIGDLMASVCVAKSENELDINKWK